MKVLRLKLRRRKPWPCAIVAPVAGPDGVHRQYVNRGSHPKFAAFGSVVEVVVGARGDEPRGALEKLARRGDEVWIECRFSRVSARTRPRPAVLVDGGGSRRHVVEDAEESDDGRTLRGRLRVGLDHVARCKVELGLAGGETCTIRVARTREGLATPDAELRVETWRRCYYQFTRPARLAPPSVDALLAAMAEVFIELRPAADVILEPGSIGAWFDGGDLGLTPGEAHVVLDGAPEDNWGHHAALMRLRRVGATAIGAPDEDVPDSLLVQLVVCDLVADRASNIWREVASARNGVSIDTEPVDGVQRPVRLTIRGRATQLCMFGNASELETIKWNFDDEWGQDRPFDLAHVSVTYSPSDGPVIVVDTRAEEAFRAGYDPAKYDPTRYPQDPEFKKSLVLFFRYTKSVPYMGAAFGKPNRRNVLVSLHDPVTNTRRSSDEVGTTLAHEVGHTLDMCMASVYAEPGLDPARHGRQYESEAGPHCADGLSDAQYQTALAQGPKFDWRELPDGTSISALCRCLMFGYSNPHRGASFCARCRPFLLGHAASSLG